MKVTLGGRGGTCIVRQSHDTQSHATAPLTGVLQPKPVRTACTKEPQSAYPTAEASRSSLRAILGCSSLTSHSYLPGEKKSVTAMVTLLCFNS